ncbi:MAG TPA: heterodisulfide reductase-related iron-sulfur binding cluster [Opitutaceae bacterium]|nr:heterodisulfide reductase-related iron-sulfur binding cluster [Opitutaceae bacterium]
MSAEPNLLRSLDYSVLQQCMRCGLCLPTCPTYLETGRERNSPRGRISLMRAIADGELGTTRAFAQEMDYCLGCLACTTACPAGVDYATLFEAGRAQSERSGAASGRSRRLIRALTLRFLLLRPWALRAAGRLLWLHQASGFRRLLRGSGFLSLLPKRLGELERQAIPIRRHFSDAVIAAVEGPRGPVRHRVAVLSGCIQDVAFSDVNRATVDVLLENGCEVATPRAQSCCGSLHAHNGDLETARVLARRQIESIDAGRYDAIISNSAGCGSHLKRYDHLLAGDPEFAGRAAAWSDKVRDISEWLVEIGFRRPAAPPPGPPPVAVTYHEACHLCHGQRITAQPREILKAIPGVELRECPESTMCCGSAGVYSITQPRTSRWLLDRKVGHLRSTGASIVATANPGCQLLIQQGFAAASGGAQGYPRVAHPVVLLAEAYKSESPRLLVL